MEQRIITARDNYIEFDQWIQENGCKKILMVCDGSIWHMDGFNKHLEEVDTAGHALCYKITSLFRSAHGHAAILYDRVLFPGWSRTPTSALIRGARTI